MKRCPEIAPAYSSAGFLWLLFQGWGRGLLFFLFFLLFTVVSSFGQDGVTISSPVTSPTQQNPVDVTFVFDRPINYFEEGDVQVFNGSLTHFYVETPEYSHLSSKLLTDFKIGFSDIFGGYEAKINQIPISIDVNSKGEIFVLTFGNGIRKFDKNGQELVFPIDGSYFTSPMDLAIDSNDEIYIADNSKRQIFVFSENGTFLSERTLGSGHSGGSKTAFYGPLGIEFDSEDNLYVADHYKGTDPTVTEPSRVKIYFKNGDFYEFYGRSSNDKFNSPYRLFLYKDLLFVSDLGRTNGRVQVFNVEDPKNPVFDTRSSILNSKVESPGSIAVDSYGFIYISDFGPNVNITEILQLEGGGFSEILQTFSDVEKGIQNEEFRIKVFDGNFNYRTDIITEIDLPVDLTLDNCGKLLVNNATLSGSYRFKFDLESYNRLPDTFTADLIIADECEPATINISSGVGEDVNCNPNPSKSSNDFVMAWDETAPLIASCSEEPVFMVESGFILPEYFSREEFSASDNCGGNLNYQQIPSANTSITEDTMVKITAIDEAGNESNVCEIFLEIQEEPDPLEISCPGDQTEDLQGDCAFTIPDYTGMASTNDSAATVIQSPVAGTEIDENTTIHLTATSNGVTDSCEFEMVLTGQPVLRISCPGDKSENADSEGLFMLPDYTKEGIVSGDCSEISVTQIPEAGTVINEDTKVTLTVTDVDGTTDSCEFEVQLVQPEPNPLEISCPGDQTEDLQGSCTFTVPDYTRMASTNDSAATVTQSPVAGTEIDGNTTIRLTATSNGVTDSCEFEVVLTGQPELLISCPGDKSENADSEGRFTLPDYTDEGIVSRDCSEISVTQIPEAGTVVNEDTMITLTVTDVDGNTDFCEFELELIQEEPEPLEISCPEDQTEDLQGDCTFTILNYTGMASTNDSAATVTQSPVAGTEIDENTTIRLTATSNGVTDSCEFEVVLTGQPVLSISCPGDKSENADSKGLFTLPDYTEGGIVSGDCSEISVTQIPEARTVINEDTMITLTVTDVDGNTDSCEFEVQLIQEEPDPLEISCPGDQTEDLQGDCTFTIPDYTGMASTNDSAATVMQSPVAGTEIDENTTIRLTATSNGVTDSCEFEVVLTGQPELLISCPGDKSENADSEGRFTLPDYTDEGIVSGDCSEISVTQIPEAGTVINEDTTITLTVTDVDGASDSCAFEVQLIQEEPEPGSNTCVDGQPDTTPPTVNCVSNFTLYLNEQGYGILTPEILDRGSTDNCRIESMNLSQTRFTTADIGTKEVVLTAIDAAGNKDTCTTQITIEAYNEEAGVDCVPSITLPLSETGDFKLELRYTGNPDNEAIEVSKTDFSCEDIGIPQTITATYWGEYTGSCLIEVIVIDDLPPVVNCVAEYNLRLNSEGKGSLTADELILRAEDNCGFVDMEVSDSEFTTADIGIPQQVTISVSDSSGNENTCTVTVNVLPFEDGDSPITCITSTELFLEEGGTATLDPRKLFTGGSGTIQYSVDREEFNCEDLGEQKVIFSYETAEEEGSCEITVFVRDPEGHCEVLPSEPFTCITSVELNLEEDGTATLDPRRLFTGGSGTIQYSVDQEEFSCEDLGEQKVIFSYETAEEAGSCEITVLVRDPKNYCTVDPVEPPVEEPYVILFPNPNNGSFYIKTSLAIDLDRANIFDMRGRYLLTVYFSENGILQTIYPLNLLHLPSGVYTIELFSGEQRFIRRAIINSE